MSNMNPFETIFEVVRQIPRGRVCTYGAISDYTGVGSPRLVGWAMHQSFSAEKPVPAHRVVNREGRLTGKHHFPTPTMMEEMLKKEGIEVENDVIVNFKQLLWHPGQ